MRLNYYLFVAVLLCCPVCLQAQNETVRHEISVGGGYYSNSELLDLYTELVTMGFTGGYASYENEKFRNPLSIEYYYHVSPLIGVGAIAVYTHSKKDIVYGGDIEGRTKSNYFTLMPAVKINWLRKNAWGLYSKVGLGASYRNEKMTSYDKSVSSKTENDVIFNFQATAIGVEAGSENYRGFMELGIGEQGVVNAGVRLRF